MYRRGTGTAKGKKKKRATNFWREGQGGGRDVRLQNICLEARKRRDCNLGVVRIAAAGRMREFRIWGVIIERENSGLAEGGNNERAQGVDDNDEYWDLSKKL